jgi:aldose sugar dehydrogenase
MMLTEKIKRHLGNPVLKIETVIKGLDWPTSMAFLRPDDILVLEKNSGKVKRIINGVMLEEPLFDAKVANKAERGMLGIAIAKHQEQNNNKT